MHRLTSVMTGAAAERARRRVGSRDKDVVVPAVPALRYICSLPPAIMLSRRRFRRGVTMAQPSVQGSFVWQELMPGDTAVAGSFYPKVLGWRSQSSPHSSAYTMFAAA